MGASSSSASAAKHHRKMSVESDGADCVGDADRRANRLLMQNGMGRETKAHSMYDLQREKSTDDANHKEAERRAAEEEERKQKADKKSPQKRKSAEGQPKAPSPAKEEKGEAPSAEAMAAASAVKRNSTQRRRPLTWAWIRGHEVSLPAEPAPEEAIERKAISTRRRSLRAGKESAVAPAEPLERQSSANSHDSSAATNEHLPLSRRSSQANPLLGQAGRQKSLRKSDVGIPGNPISASGREIIQFCFDNPHNEIGTRICSRLLEKRPDFRQFAYSMGKERWQQMTVRLKEFLETVVRRVDTIDAVERISRKYGEEHVELKCFGFKPDFWVSLADAITVECVILDMATHQPSDTITAWSLLVSIMFSAVRDGYYQAMRMQRISQRHRNANQRETESKAPEGAHHQLRTAGSVEKSASANELQSPTRNVKAAASEEKRRNTLERNRERKTEKGGAKKRDEEEKRESTKKQSSTVLPLNFS